ncbi:RNA-directed DNA polymerase, eukaryota, reverse transcriptase zinc-binding domain protein [Tanacetum coccineum]
MKKYMCGWEEENEYDVLIAILKLLVGECKAVYANKGACVNIMPNSIFKHLKLTSLLKIDMLVEMADMTRQAPLGIVKNILIKSEKFVFPCDFVVINMPGNLSKMMILGRPFLATIHAQIDVFNKEISLGIREDGVLFDMDEREHGMLKQRMCFHDHERQSVERNRMIFVDFLKVLDNFDIEADYGKTRDDPYSMRFDEYKKVFGNKAEQLANEYDLRIGNKGYVLDEVWGKCEKFHEVTLYPWHDEGFEVEDQWESGIEKTYYKPPFADIKTFEIKKYSFNRGRSFVCITK